MEWERRKNEKEWIRDGGGGEGGGEGMRWGRLERWIRTTKIRDRGIHS